MVVDTSALIAILYAENDAEIYATALAAAEVRFISAANYLETGIVIDRQRGAAAGRQFDSLLLRAAIVVEPVTQAQADIARLGYLEFGKGIHPAGLNFADCFSYALAKSMSVPLLFKGKNFALTDVASALDGL